MSEATPFDPNTWIPPVQETAKERAWRRFTEEPLVPLGNAKDFPDNSSPSANLMRIIIGSQAVALL